MMKRQEFLGRENKEYKGLHGDHFGLLKMACVAAGWQVSKGR